MVFCGSSTLLAIFYGTALGTVVRGVPNRSGRLLLVPLWTDLRTSPRSGIIDWYTLMVGATALLVLTVHGALWVAIKTSGVSGGTRDQRGQLLHPAETGRKLRRSSIHVGLSDARCRRTVRLRLCLTAGLDLWAFIGSGVFVRRPALQCCVRPLSGRIVGRAGRESKPHNLQRGGAPVWIRDRLLLADTEFLPGLGYSFLVCRHFRGKVRLSGQE